MNERKSEQTKEEMTKELKNETN